MKEIKDDVCMCGMETDGKEAQTDVDNEVFLGLELVCVSCGTNEDVKIPQNPKFGIEPICKECFRL